MPPLNKRVRGAVLEPESWDKGLSFVDPIPRFRDPAYSWAGPDAQAKILSHQRVPARVGLPGRSDSQVRQLFAQLAERWSVETALSSNLTKDILHPAYQQIIGLGLKAVPLIIERMLLDDDQWFWALVSITGEDPATGVADYDGARNLWVAWARARGYVGA